MQHPFYQNNKKYIEKGYFITPQNEHSQAILQNRASSSLCELSNNICADQQAIQQQNKMREEQVGYSPWKLNKEQIKLSTFYTKACKRIKTVGSENKGYSIIDRNPFLFRSKRNFTSSKSSKYDNQAQMKRFPSVFARLSAHQSILKKQASDIEMITILKKNKDTQPSKSYIKRMVLEQRPQIAPLQPKHKANLNGFNDVSVRRLGSNQNEKKMNDSQISEYQLKHISQINDSFGLQQNWKIKNMTIKNKLTKKTQNDRKNYDRIENKENILQHPIPKGTISFDKKYNQQYQSKNPLTKILYEKVMTTISMTRPLKEGRYGFI